MERKTINYYRELIAKGFNANAIKEVIEKYGHKSGDIVKIYLGRQETPFHWNHRIEGFFIGRDGQVWLDIYWQGDSTDGNDSICVRDFNYRNEVVIRAEHEWLGDRTYCRHSDIRVSREELNEANAALIQWLSPEAIKARKEAEALHELKMRVSNYTGNELYETYASRGCWGRDERWFNGKHGVDLFVEINTKKLIPLAEPELRKAIKSVFLANYKYDREIITKPSPSRFEEPEKTYNISYDFA